MSNEIPEEMYFCPCAKLIEADIDLAYEEGKLDRVSLFELWLESTGNCSACYFTIYNKIMSLRGQDYENSL